MESNEGGITCFRDVKPSENYIHKRKWSIDPESKINIMNQKAYAFRTLINLIYFLCMIL